VGRTIPSFRISAVLEEKTWKEYREHLNKSDRTVFDKLFTVATLYNSASSYAAIPIRIHPIMISIAFHHYKTLKEKNKTISEIEDQQLDIKESNILQKELKKWKTYSDILRQPNRDLFNEMLKSIYKYSNSIEAKGENYATESLIMSLLLEQYKKLIQY
jgi:hypothetical protein